MKAKDMKDAAMITLNLDKARPATFDFNSLAELQDIYPNPYDALDGLETMKPKETRAIIYAMLKSGAEAKGQEFDLTLTQVGTIFGSLFRDQDKLGEEMVKVGKAIADFFPEPPKADKSGDETKN